MEVLQKFIRKDAEILKDKFQELVGEFGVEIKILVNKTDEPVGRGVGPVLETKKP